MGIMCGEMKKCAGQYGGLKVERHAGGEEGDAAVGGHEGAHASGESANEDGTNQWNGIIRPGRDVRGNLTDSFDNAGGTVNFEEADEDEFQRGGLEQRAGTCKVDKVPREADEGDEDIVYEDNGGASEEHRDDGPACEAGEED